MWFVGVEVEQETSSPPPKKNPGSAPVHSQRASNIIYSTFVPIFDVCRFSYSVSSTNYDLVRIWEPELS